MRRNGFYTRLSGPGTPIVWLGSRVLIVEDNPAFAELIQYSLNGSGYDVETAATVGDARRRLREDNGPPIDLVITDIRLPHGSGVELLFPDHHAKHRPAVLVMTAFASRELKNFLAGMGFPLLEKPFSIDLLRAQVMETLLLRHRHPVFGP